MDTFGSAQPQTENIFLQGQRLGHQYHKIEPLSARQRNAFRLRSVWKDISKYFKKYIVSGCREGSEEPVQCVRF